MEADPRRGPVLLFGSGFWDHLERPMDRLEREGAASMAGLKTDGEGSRSGGGGEGVV